MQGPAAFSFSIFLGLTPCGSQLDLQLPWSPGPNVHLNSVLPLTGAMTERGSGGDALHPCVVKQASITRSTNQATANRLLRFVWS
ncbi:hypothetical protein PR002_g20389 [Phytophthora rubi]|uniref:Secreted protein n=1 Tax=Phytophthora rubi TaxID=129364 RepID=A0A6A3JDX1_9STRA|nr:hypothetical protein PR002_g20389 [Phytophthora rubi]